jgi:hypothetical protein
MARLAHDFFLQRGYRVFMDVEELKSGPFNTALFDEIDSATDVVVVLSPGSLDRCHEENDWFRLEIAYAIQKGKNVIPVMIRGFQWPSNPLPKDIAALPNYHGIEPSHVLFKESMEKLASLLLAKSKPQRPWLKGGVAAAVAVVLVVAAGILGSSLGVFETNRGSLPPITTSRDIEAVTFKVLAIAHQCMQDPSVVADRRVELQQLAAKVSADPRYGEDAPGPTAALYRLVAASLFFTPAGDPDRERIKEGLFWLGKLRELSPTLRNDSQLKDIEGFFSAFVEGRAPRWNGDQARRHAATLALLGSKDVDDANLSTNLTDRAKGSGIVDGKDVP